MKFSPHLTSSLVIVIGDLVISICHVLIGGVILAADQAGPGVGGVKRIG
jgi:hypothetical protein